MCVRRTDCGLRLNDRAPAATVCLTQYEPRTPLYCSSGRSSLRATTTSEQTFHIHPVALEFGICKVVVTVCWQTGCIGTTSRPPRLFGTRWCQATILPVGRPHSQRGAASTEASPSECGSSREPCFECLRAVRSSEIRTRAAHCRLRDGHFYTRPGLIPDRNVIARLAAAVAAGSISGIRSKGESVAWHDLPASAAGTSNSRSSTAAITSMISGEICAASANRNGQNAVCWKGMTSSLLRRDVQREALLGPRSPRRLSRGSQRGHLRFDDVTVPEGR